MLEIHLLMRAVHILAGAVWVGGSMMYLVVVSPVLRSNASAATTVAPQLARLFKRMVNICMGLLIVSGAYLTFDRLTQTTLGLPYMIVLVIKIAVAIGLFLLAIYLGQSNIRRLAKRTTYVAKIAPQLMLALGIIVFILGALLNSLFEVAIAPH